MFQRAKISTRSITHLCWCIWRIFWKENFAGISQCVSCSCTTTPLLTGHLQPRRNWSTCASSIWSPTLFSGSGPVGLPPVPWTEKQLKIHHFFSTWKSLLPRRPGWTDKFLNFSLSGFQTLEHRSKECIELHGDMMNK